MIFPPWGEWGEKEPPKECGTCDHWDNWDTSNHCCREFGLCLWMKLWKRIGPTWWSRKAFCDCGWTLRRTRSTRETEAALADSHTRRAMEVAK